MSSQDPAPSAPIPPASGAATSSVTSRAPAPRTASDVTVPISSALITSGSTMVGNPTP